ncbi:hypothetical protein [Belnapia rosea]|uniref:hypothetical protein n=1 Tax=Belnapia rosea TaxID=938405 RepID=UPI0038D04330
MERLGGRVSDIAYLGHGTTVATNALIQHRGGLPSSRCPSRLGRSIAESTSAMPGKTTSCRLPCRPAPQALPLWPRASPQHIAGPMASRSRLGRCSL